MYQWGVSIIAGADGFLYLLAAIAGIVFSILGKNTIVVISGAVALVIFVLESISIFRDELASVLLSMGIGYYLIMISSITLIVAGIIGKIQQR